MLPGVQLLYADCIQVARGGDAIGYIVGYLLVGSAQIFLQEAVLFQLFVQQQDAEKELVHPVSQGIHVYMLFFQFHFRGGTRQSFSGTYIPTIPEGLLHFEHHLVLVFRSSLDVEIRDFDR